MSMRTSGSANDWYWRGYDARPEGLPDFDPDADRHLREIRSLPPRPPFPSREVKEGVLVTLARRKEQYERDYEALPERSLLQAIFRLDDLLRRARMAETLS